MSDTQPADGLGGAPAWQQHSAAKKRRIVIVIAVVGLIVSTLVSILVAVGSAKVTVWCPTS